MSATQNLETAYNDGDLISASVVNDITNALITAFVGRGSDGIPASGQSLGTVVVPWGTLFAGGLNINGQSIDLSNVLAPGNRVISGQVRTLSEQPEFIAFDNINPDITIEGNTVNLQLSINGSAVTVSTDVAVTSLTVAPSSNNTCLVNEPTFADEESTKYAGEGDNTLNIDNAGSEITSRVGQLVVLQKNTDSNELMLCYVKSTTELTNCYRGFFYDYNSDPIVREVLTDNDQLNIMSTGWIFVEDDGTSVDISYESPVYSFTAPGSPVAGKYWFDMANDQWKRYSGASFVVVNRTLVGIAVVNQTKTIGQRSADYYSDYRDTNTVELEVDSTSVIKSKDKTNNIYVYSKLLTIDPTHIEWDSATDLDTGIIGNDKTYHFYIASTGERIISLEREYERIDLKGKYHPYEAYKYIGKAKTDGSGNWISVISSSTFDNQSSSAKFESDGLLIDVTSNTEVTVSYKKLKLINALGQSKTLYNKTHVFDMEDASHLQGPELPNHQYQLWIDEFEQLKLVPDLTGTTDGTTAGFIDHSANLFATYSVFKSAVAYNMTDLTKTTVSVSATVDNNDLAVVDDIFSSGEDYKIHILDPVGLGEFKANIGAANNNGSSNLDDSTYTQIQEEKTYSEAAGDFTASVANWTTTDAVSAIRQVNDWSGKGRWKINSNIGGNLSVASTTLTLVHSGVVFKNNGVIQAINGVQNTGAAAYVNRSYATQNANTLVVKANVVTTAFALTSDVELERKATFHH